MQYIKETLLDDHDEWDKIVRSFPNYDVFYLSSYVKAFKSDNYGEPLLISYENGSDRAINVVYRRDIGKDENFIGKLETDKYYDLTTPYGYGGFWGEVLKTDKLLKNYDEYCIRNGYICEFVRFNLFTNYKDYFNGDIQTRTRNVVRNLDLSIENIWLSFKYKVRKNVKRALKNNLQIIHDHTGKYLDDFLRIYYGTMDRNRSEKDFYFSREFFEILNNMKDNVMYFHVVYNDTIVSTELVLYDNENCYSYLGGTDSVFFNVRPNDFLKFEIIKWAKDKGLRNFVLGGGYGADDGIFQFKAGFAPDGLIDFYIGKKIFNEDLYHSLVKMRGQEIKNRDFFPLYRG